MQYIVQCSALCTSVQCTSQCIKLQCEMQSAVQCKLQSSALCSAVCINFWKTLSHVAGIHIFWVCSEPAEVCCYPIPLPQWNPTMLAMHIPIMRWLWHEWLPMAVSRVGLGGFKLTHFQKRHPWDFRKFKDFFGGWGWGREGGLREKKHELCQIVLNKQQHLHDAILTINFDH